MERAVVGMLDAQTKRPMNAAKKNRIDCHLSASVENAKSSLINILIRYVLSQFEIFHLAGQRINLVRRCRIRDEWEAVVRYTAARTRHTE